jgi:glycopeptide antibiotics resistance protein
VRPRSHKGSLLLPIWSGAALASAALICAATLFPFDFEFRAISVREYFHSFRYFPSSFRDVPENIVLFAPFGYCVAALLSRSTTGLGVLILRTSYAAFAVTLLVESLQIFLPTRVSNVSDLLANTLGAVVGGSAFRFFLARAFWKQQFAHGLPARVAIAIAIFFFCVATLFLVFLNWGMHPRKWDPSYKLACGNELTGDRPWQGSLWDVLVLDEAVRPFEASQIIAGTVPLSLTNAVLASYSLDGAAPFLDSAKKSPALVPAAQHPSIGNDHVELGGGIWLLSKAGMAAVSSRVNLTKEFTVAFTVAISDPAQSGPARIVTVSETTDRRNFTIGQEGSDLVLRWRSPLQGENGSSAQARFHAVFEDSRVQRLVLTLSRADVCLYRLNERALCLPMTAALGLSALIYEDETHSMYAGPVDGIFVGVGIFDALLGAITSLPIGLALGCIRGLGNRGLIFRVVVPAAFGMAVLQQVLIAYFAGTKFSAWTVMVNFCLVTVSCLGIFWLRHVLEARRFAENV